MKRTISLIAAIGIASAGALAADNFEPYAASAAGISVAGQNGWYNPVSGGPTLLAYTYSGNSLGFAQNPVGLAQFIGGMAGSNSSWPRIERSQAFTASNIWTVSYNMAVKFNGTGSASNNIAKFSLQPEGTTKSFNATAQWPSLTSPTQWHYGYEVADSSGQLSGNNQYPATAWRFLATNHWYRFSTSFDFTTNTILYTTISDLHTGQVITARPDAFYLNGGASSSLPRPSAVRFFIGGNVAGNAMGVDNFEVAQNVGVIPETVNIQRGQLFSGTLPGVFDSDDAKIVYRPGPVASSAEMPLQLVFTGTSYRTGASIVQAQVESSASANNITQIISLFNYQTGAFEQVDSRVLTGADTLVQVTISTNAARFVEPLGTRQMQIKLAYRASGPVPIYPWLVRLDKVGWFVN